MPCLKGPAARFQRRDQEQAEGQEGIRAPKAGVTSMLSFRAVPEVAFSEGEQRRTGQLVLLRLSCVHQGGSGSGGLALRLTSQHTWFKRKEENRRQEDVIRSLGWRMGSKRSVLLITVNC